MKQLSKVLILLFILSSLAIIISACTKVETTPISYTPNFYATSSQDIIGGIEVLEFNLVCTTNDVKVSNLAVNSPDGTNYSYSGGLFIQNQQMNIPDTFVKLTGSWQITIIGEVNGGKYDGLAFNTSVNLNVSKKKKRF